MKKVKQLSKVLCMLLAALLLMQTATFAEAPKVMKKQCFANFGERTELSAMKVWYNTNESTVPTVSNDPEGWQLSIKSNKNYIYCDVDDNFLYNLNGEAVEIEVDYFDKGEGVFTLTYEGLEDATEDAELVDLTDTGALKTHTFYIQDAYFRNGLEKADFRIAVSSDFLKSYSEYSIRSDITFCAVRVKKAERMSPVQINLSTDSIGNIFYTGEKIKFAEMKFGLTPVSWRKDDLKERQQKGKELVNGTRQFELTPTGEEGVEQMRALLGLRDLVTNVNIPNYGQIPNLPLGAVVETNATFRANELRPVFAGNVPAPIYPLISRIVGEQENVAQAIKTRDLDMAFNAFCNDPLVTIDQKSARELFCKMLNNTKKYLTMYDLKKYNIE